MGESTSLLCLHKQTWFCRLIRCIELNYDAELDALISANKNQSHLDAALLRAAELGRFRACVKLIKHGAHVNARSEADDASTRRSRSGKSQVHVAITGQTPLHKSAQNSHAEVTDLLLSVGADANARDSSGRTALMLASQTTTTGTQQTLASILKLKCVKINTADLQGRTALHYATAAGNFNTLKVLMHCGARIQSVDERGDTALSVACKKLCEDFGKSQDSVKCIQLLLEGGCVVNAENEAGNTALTFAVMANSKTAVRMLLQNGAAVSEAVLLQCAIESKNPEIFEDLLEATDEEDISDSFLWSVLVYIVSCDVSKWQMNSDQDVNITYALAQNIIGKISSNKTAEMVRLSAAEALREECSRIINLDQLAALQRLGILGFTIWRGKLGIARNLHAAGLGLEKSSLQQIEGMDKYRENVAIFESQVKLKSEAGGGSLGVGHPLDVSNGDELFDVVFPEREHSRATAAQIRHFYD